MALDSFRWSLCSVESSVDPSLVIADADRLDRAQRLRPHQIDRQQPVLEVRTQDLHAIGQYERALKLTCRDAAVQILARLVVLLLAADDELAFLHRHVELLAGEAGDRKRDAQPLRAILIARDALDVVGRIAVGSPGYSIESTLGFVETAEERP